MRQIVLDTETTGLDAKTDRIVEVGCVELLNLIPTGRQLQLYINPGMRMPAEAQAVHGLTDAFLADKPSFAQVAEELIAFLGDASLIAHNAEFDFRFLNAEFGRVGASPIAQHRVIDTLMLARRKHPGGANTLDALCSRYGIDTSKRTLHGALLDSELLAEVYIELNGGRQASLVLADTLASPGGMALPGGGRPKVGPRPEPWVFRVSAAEMDAHRDALAMLKDKAIWLSYLPAEDMAGTAN